MAEGAAVRSSRDGSALAVRTPVGRDVLGIPVDPRRLLQWRDWLMPDEQPFVMTKAQARELGLTDEPGRVTQEAQGSFMLYGVDDLAVCWVTREQASALPASIISSQPGEHHWSSADVEADVERVAAYVVDGRRPSRHMEITAAQWRTIASVLPKARRLAGTFPDGSGPNCFATVMAAAGIEGAEHTWMLREPFEQWLAEHTVRLAARDRRNDLGVVYVRRRDGLVDHAAVSLGEGYALHKPSDGWMSPTKVLTVRELMASARVPGRRVQRHVLR